MNSDSLYRLNPLVYIDPKMPEKAPRWDLTGIEGCGGGKVVSRLPWMFLGYKSIYRRKI